MAINSGFIADGRSPAGTHTLREILNQPVLWPTTLRVVHDAANKLGVLRQPDSRVLITGAGTSAYAANAVAAAWANAVAIPTTDLLVDPRRHLSSVDLVVSLARSGDSPESVAVVQQARALFPRIRHVAIVCNRDGALAHAGTDALIVLDPRTNDKSLVMTSSFSNLVLAGLLLARSEEAAATVTPVSERVAALLPEIERSCVRAACNVRDRVVVLSSSPLLGWAREAGLKILEMTAGRFSVMIESYLGLRHGPMSFVGPTTFVLCLLSSHFERRAYELDLVDELRRKQLGYLVGIAGQDDSDRFDDLIPAAAPELDDVFRTPYEIAAAQLLGYHLSLLSGCNPDSPSPEGIINRVVQGFRIHSAWQVPLAQDRGI